MIAPQHSIRPGQRKVQRTGGAEAEPFDLRVIASSSEDLAMQLDVATFHADLYDYLAVYTLSIPALRDRPEDIAPLAQKMVDPVRLDDETLRALGRARLPGNARDLRQLLNQALQVRVSGDLRLDDLDLRT